MEKINRKELKQRAKKIVKSHYWILMVACLAAAVLGSDFSDSLQFLKLTKDDTSTQTVQEASAGSRKEDVRTGVGFEEIVSSIVENNLDEYQRRSEETLSEQEKTRQESFGAIKIGRSRGVLALVVNKVQSGSFYLMIIVTIQSILKSRAWAGVIFILLSFVLISGAWFLVVNTFEVIYSRMFLEARTYEKVPARKFLFLIRTKSLFHVTRVMLVRTVYLVLWSFTVIGGMIKFYSYRMVAYIVAENPRIKTRDAINLSRRMMMGHKWECFILEMSFILWYILDAFTLGLIRLFWLNSYITATLTEYYADLRRRYIEEKKEGYELLNDRYLYEHASEESLYEAYADVVALKDEPRFEYTEKNPVLRLLQSLVGVVLFYDENEKKRREQAVKDANILNLQDVVKGKVYPGRLSGIEKDEKVKSLENLSYLRCYSLMSLIMIFFMFCIVGWLWEVSLHLITSGTFVNRGVLHGPWLPIYGTGGVMILLLLYRFRKWPWLEFFLAVVLAGIVEYTTALHLERTHGGTQWWNYDNYYLNINGRVCAEGLLVFGLGGIAVVYLLAPMMDNQLSRIRGKILLPICVVLLTVYAVDMVYSGQHPNSGKGITDYESEYRMPQESPYRMLYSEQMGSDQAWKGKSSSSSISLVIGEDNPPQTLPGQGSAVI